MIAEFGLIGGNFAMLQFAVALCAFAAVAAVAEAGYVAHAPAADYYVSTLVITQEMI